MKKKEEAVAISLKLKQRLTRNSFGAVENALLIAKNSGARIYLDRDYRIIILSPSLIKSTDIYRRTIRIAKEMEKLLIEHNAKFKDKIDFGIGLSSGEIISEARGKEFKFTSVGNIISVAKKVSGFSEGEMLISNSVRAKVAGKFKFEKGKSEGVWKLKNKK